MKFGMKNQALLMTGILLTLSHGVFAHGNGQHHHGHKGVVKKVVTIKHNNGRVVKKVVTKRGNKTIIKKTITHKPHHKRHTKKVVHHHQPNHHQRRHVQHQPAARYINHTHNGRSHSHPLPASGVHHNHNMGGHTANHHRPQVQKVVTRRVVTHHRPVQNHHSNGANTIAKIVVGGLILNGLIDHFDKKSDRKHHTHHNNQRPHHGHRANQRPHRKNRSNHRRNGYHVKHHHGNKAPTFAVYAR